MGHPSADWIWNLPEARQDWAPVAEFGPLKRKKTTRCSIVQRRPSFFAMVSASSSQTLHKFGFGNLNVRVRVGVRHQSDAGPIIGVIVAALAGLFLFISLKKAVFMVSCSTPSSTPSALVPLDRVPLGFACCMHDLYGL
jgi:hypothetical protein